jgi:hypothetical protein
MQPIGPLWPAAPALAADVLPELARLPPLTRNSARTRADVALMRDVDRLGRLGACLAVLTSSLRLTSAIRSRLR